MWTALSVAGFDAGTLSYEFGVAASVARVTVSGVAADAGAGVAYSGADADAAVEGHQVDLVEGRNTVTVTVTAEDGIAVRKYTVSVNRGSDAPYRWRAAEDFDTLAAAGNNQPYGVWSDGTTMWVADPDDDKLYAYLLADGQRDPGRDIDTLAAAGNYNQPYGVWSDGTTMWVMDLDDDKLYAYLLAGGQRDPGRDIDTLAAAGNNDPSGVWSDGTTMWVADWGDDKLYAYLLSGGQRVPGRDVDTLAAAGNDEPFGVWSDGMTMWVADLADDKLYAYLLAGGQREPGRDFDTLDGAGNNAPWGVWSDGATMWVADIVDDKLYSYNLPDSNNANLSGLSLSDGTLTPTFDSATDTYTAQVANSVAHITVTATADDDGATVAIAPADANSDTEAHEVSLGVGATTITVTVTAQDGATTRVYTVTVTRAADTAAPAFVSASCTHNLCTLTFDEDLDGAAAALPPLSFFTVSTTRPGDDASAPVALQGVAVDGAQVTITLDAPHIGQNQPVSVNYDDNSTGDLAAAVQDTAGNDAAAVPDTAATNTSTRTAPAAPTAPAATASSETRIELSWTAPAELGGYSAADIAYQVEVSPNGNDGWSVLVDASDAHTATTYAHTGLAAGDTRHYRVAAVNPVGAGAYSVTAGATTFEANNAPMFPAGPITRSVAENSGAGTVVGAAVTATDDDGDSLSYALAGADAASFTVDSGTGQIRTDAALDHESVSSYSVTVTADDGNGGTATVSVAISVGDVDEPPAKPAAPSVAATADTTDSLSVSWTAPANTGPDITGYAVQYRESGVTGWTAHSHSGTATTATISGLAAGTEYQVQVSASNDEGTSDWSDSGVGSTNAPANASPVFPAGPIARSVDENSAAGTDVGAAVAAVDVDGDTLTYTLGGADAASFTIDSGTGQIKTDAALDFESVSSYSVTVTADDGNGGTATVSVAISVGDVDEPPAKPAAPSVAAVADTTDSLSVSWTAPANTGPDVTGYGLQYRESGVTGWTAHSHSGTGASATISGLAAGTEYQVQVSASNDEGTSDWSASGVGSTNAPANASPMFPAGPITRSVDENSGVGTDVGVPVTATDDDGDTLSYTLGGDAASFAIDESSGQIRTDAPLDFESRSSYSVTVTAADGNGGTATVSVEITVGDVDEPPAKPAAPSVAAVADTTDSLSVSWTAPANTGPDVTGYGLQYRESGVTGWTAHSHSGTGASATISGLAAGTEYQVQVSASNDEGTSDWSASGVGSTNAPANASPMFPAGPITRSVDENSGVGTDVGVPVTATDDDGDTLSYTLGGDAASFAIDSASGQITTSAGLDHESKSSYSVMVTADDSKGGTATVSVVISVGDVAEPPPVPAAPSVEAVSGSTTSLDVSWSAPDTSGRPDVTGYGLQYRESGVTGWTAHSHSGTGASATISGLAAGTEYQVQVSASNDEGTSDWSASGVGSTNAPANASPMFPAGPITRSVDENSGVGTDVGVPVTATDDDGDTLSYTLGGDAASFAIDESSGQIRTDAPLDFESRSSYSVTVTAADGNGGTATVSVAISVGDVDEPPAKPAAPSVAAVADTTDSLSVSWTAPANTGPDVTGYGLQYRESGVTGWTAHSHSGTGASATISGLAAGTEYQVQVSASNDEGTSDWSASGVGSTNAPANASPMFPAGPITRSVDENSGVGTDVGVPVTATDDDGDTLSYTLGGDAASFAIDSASGQITTSAGLDHESKSSYSVMVTADDSKGGTATVSVVISVGDVAEPPPVPAAPSVEAVSGSTTSLDVSWSAPDTSGRPDVTGYGLQYRESGVTGWTAHSHSGTGASATISGLAAGTEYQVQVSASNDEGTSDWSASGVGSTNAPANASPMFPAGPITRSVDENSGVGTDVGVPVTATDDDGDTLSYTLGGDAASFAIDESSGQIRTDAPLDFESRSSYSVTVTAADGNGGTATVSVAITVGDVDEPPAKPAAPSVAAVADTTDSLSVSWVAPANTGPAISDYDVQYRAGTSGSWTDWPHTGTATTATITGLAVGTEYLVQVLARNDEGTSDWSASGTGSTSEANQTPLTAEFADIPQRHGGTGAFNVRILFSEDIQISFRDFPAAVDATGATVTGARRHQGDRSHWEIDVQPDGNTDVVLVLAPTNACTDTGAVCTGDGKQLSNRLEGMVWSPNRAPTGEVTITGSAQMGQTLSADISKIDDPDGLGDPGWAYQWIRINGTTEAEIQGATGSSYTLVHADMGSTIMVEAALTDDRGTTETLTSEPTAPVVAAPAVDTTPPTFSSGSCTHDTCTLTFSEPLDAADTAPVSAFSVTARRRPAHAGHRHRRRQQRDADGDRAGDPSGPGPAGRLRRPRRRLQRHRRHPRPRRQRRRRLHRGTDQHLDPGRARRAHRIDRNRRRRDADRPFLGSARRLGRLRRRRHLLRRRGVRRRQRRLERPRRHLRRPHRHRLRS